MVPAAKTWRNQQNRAPAVLALFDSWESYPNSTQSHRPRLKDLEKQTLCQHAGSCPCGQRPTALTKNRAGLVFGSDTQIQRKSTVPALKTWRNEKNCQHAGSCPQGQRPKALTRGAWRTDSPNHTREARANNTHTI